MIIAYIFTLDTVCLNVTNLQQTLNSVTGDDGYVLVFYSAMLPVTDTV